MIKSKYKNFKNYKNRRKQQRDWIFYNFYFFFQNLPINDFAKSKLDITSKELEEERAEANNVLKK